MTKTQGTSNLIDNFELDVPWGLVIGTCGFFSALFFEAF